MASFDEEALRERQAEWLRIARLYEAGQILASVADKVNEPLYAIAVYARGAIRRLHKESLSSGDCIQAMEEILAEAGRATEAVKHLQASIAKHSRRRLSIDLNSLIRDAVKLVDAEARRGCTAVNLELAQDLPLVLADPVEVEQVVLHLVRNGLEAVADLAAGDRTLSIRTWQKSQKTVEVTVCDSGKSIGQGTAEKLFEPFFTTKPARLGLGLAICQTIINAHAGHIWVASGPRKTTAFHFTLPVGKPTCPAKM